MTVSDLSAEAVAIRHLYAESQKRRGKQPWGASEYVQGFVGDVGDLTKLVMAKEGLRPQRNVDAALRHELSDCLWSILVLAAEYDVDLESAFRATMVGLRKKLKPRRRTRTAQTSRARRD